MNIQLIKIFKQQRPAVFPLIYVSTGLFITVILYGCGLDRTISFPPAEPYPEKPAIEDPLPLEPSGNGPAGALYNEAKVSMAQGNNRKAELAIERALRIEPGNAYYWYTLGKIKYRKGAYEEAIQLCLKSKSLAGKNLNLKRANDTLIGMARKDSGNKSL